VDRGDHAGKKTLASTRTVERGRRLADCVNEVECRPVKDSIRADDDGEDVACGSINLRAGNEITDVSDSRDMASLVPSRRHSPIVFQKTAFSHLVADVLDHDAGALIVELGDAGGSSNLQRIGGLRSINNLKRTDLLRLVGTTGYISGYLALPPKKAGQAWKHTMVELGRSLS
jgi:hypothetical protein